MLPKTRIIFSYCYYNEYKNAISLDHWIWKSIRSILWNIIFFLSVTVFLSITDAYTGSRKCSNICHRKFSSVCLYQMSVKIIVSLSVKIIVSRIDFIVDRDRPEDNTKETSVRGWLYFWDVVSETQFAETFKIVARCFLSWRGEIWFSSYRLCSWQAGRDKFTTFRVYERSYRKARACFISAIDNVKLGLNGEIDISVRYVTRE